MNIKNKTKEKMILDLIAIGFTSDKAEIEVEEFPRNAIWLVENAKVGKEKKEKNKNDQSKNN